MQECTWTGEQSRRNPPNLLIITTPSDLFGINCATGMSALMRKELLDNKGGFEAFGCYLAEDFFFAQAVQVGSWWQGWERRWWQRWVTWGQWRRPYDNKSLATKVNCGQRALPQQMQERKRYLENFIHTLLFREQKCKTRKHKDTQKTKEYMNTEHAKLVQEQKYKLAVSSQPAAQNPANSTVTSFQNRMSRWL